MKNKNPYIELYRFALMLWIVLFHFTTRFETLFPDSLYKAPCSFSNGGTIGVSIFFIISGFFMAKTLLLTKEKGVKTMIYYCWKRFIRLWPAYIVCCIFIGLVLWFYPLPGRTIELKYFFANAFIVHIGKNLPYVDGAHWFISDLLKMQFLLSICFLVCRQYRHFLILGVSALISINGFLIQIHPTAIGEMMEQHFYSRYLWCVMIGISLWMVQSKSYNRAYLIIPVLLLIKLTQEYHTSLLLIWCVVFIGCFYLPKYMPTINPRLSSIMPLLGSISFVWYLMHQNIGYLLLDNQVFTKRLHHACCCIFYPYIQWISLIGALFSTLIFAYVIDYIIKKLILK